MGFTPSSTAILRMFQRNSKTDMTNPAVQPKTKTTKTPPTLAKPSSACDAAV